jgi:hypothetical protein
MQVYPVKFAIAVYKRLSKNKKQAIIAVRRKIRRTLKVK